MDIRVEFERRKCVRKWIAYVNPCEEPPEGYFNFPQEEDFLPLNQWCIDTLGYHARTAWDKFEFKKKSHLEWFILRWA